MADNAPGRGMVIAATVMVVVGQVLAIANDVFLRQSDPSDVVLLVVLVVLSFFLVRRAQWARWTTVVLVGIGGILELAGVALLVAIETAPGFRASASAAVPVLASLHDPVVAFTASPAFPLLLTSVLASAVLDLWAAGILAFAPSVRSYFGPAAAGPGT